MSYSCRNLWLGVDLSYCGTESSQKRTTNHTFWLPLSGLSETTASPPVTSWTTARRKAKIFWILFGPMQKLMIFMWTPGLKVWTWCLQVWTFMFAGMNFHVHKYIFNVLRYELTRLQVWTFRIFTSASMEFHTIYLTISGLVKGIKILVTPQQYFVTFHG